MRLELNNSGAWKLVIREVKPEALNLVRLACLDLCIASDGTQLSWRLVVPSDVHPRGQVVQHTDGHGLLAQWVHNE